MEHSQNFHKKTVRPFVLWSDDIVGSKSFPIDNFQTFQFQYNLHRLEWGFGDYKFNDAIEDIALKLKSDTVYIKGNDKIQVHV